MTRIFAIVMMLIGVPSWSIAQCESLYDSDLNDLTWTVFSESRYTICYDNRYAVDSHLAQTWIDNAFEVALTKYQVVPPVRRRGYDLQITIFLVPTPTSRANSYTATVTCCSDSVNLEIHIMTPSAPYYDQDQDHFIKTLTHEMMNTLHYEAREPPNIVPPLWIREGLAEYEGYFKTTPANEAKVDWLMKYVYENLRDEIIYGRNLMGGSPEIISMDRYNGSAVVMIFLAEYFGEDAHYRLFQQPLGDILEEYRIDSLSAFQWLGWWLEQKCMALSECEVE